MARDITVTKQKFYDGSDFVDNNGDIWVKGKNKKISWVPSPEPKEDEDPWFRFVKPYLSVTGEDLPDDVDPNTVFDSFKGSYKKIEIKDKNGTKKDYKYTLHTSAGDFDPLILNRNGN